MASALGSGAAKRSSVDVACGSGRQTAAIALSRTRKVHVTCWTSPKCTSTRASSSKSSNRDERVSYIGGDLLEITSGPFDIVLLVMSAILRSSHVSSIATKSTDALAPAVRVVLQSACE